jgi:hypothetical protein
MAKVGVNTRSRLLMYQIFLRLAKQWVRKRERSVDDKYLPRTDSPFGKAQSNSR